MQRRNKSEGGERTVKETKEPERRRRRRKKRSNKDGDNTGKEVGLKLTGTGR